MADISVCVVACMIAVPCTSEQVGKCLKKHGPSIAKPCKQTIDRTITLHDVCKKEIAGLCEDVADVACLKKHNDKLLEPCKVFVKNYKEN